MRPRQGIEGKVIAGGIVLALLLLHPFAYAQEPVAPQGTSSQSQGQVPASAPDAAGTAAGPSTNQSSGDQLPDSPGAVPAKPNPPQAMTPSTAPADNSKSSDPDPAPSQQSDPASNPAPPAPPTPSQPNDQEPDRSSPGQPASSQTGTQPFAQSQQQQQSPHDPRGTAAAESVPTTGIAASRPAGAAVAPAKQRRVRSILIKVGALVGAGVAIGTTMALSQGSPSRPPGSH